MKLSISAFGWWVFGGLLTVFVKLGLDQLLGITSVNLWGSLMTSGIAFVLGFGIVWLFKRHERGSIVGAA